MHPNVSTTSLPHLDYRWVAVVSLLLSAWLIALDPLINRDAIIYLRAADAYLVDGFSASQQLYGRPLLPIGIALLHQLTGLPLLYAGLLITTLSYAILCVAFVATVHVLGGNRTVQVLGAVVILSHPWLNHLRSSIMRDPTYWALLLLSLRELLLFTRRPSFKSQCLWLGYVLLASLLRFEGLFFAFLAPFALLLTPGLPHRARHLLFFLLPLGTVVSLTAIALVWYQQQVEATDRLFPAIALYVDKLRALPSELFAFAQSSAAPILTFSAREDAQWALLAALGAILLLNIARALTWPWLLTLIWGWRRQLQLRLRPEDRTVICTYTLIALGYLTVFTLLNRFMLERYATQVVVFLLLLVPFILAALWHAGGWRKWLVIALLAGMSVDTLHTGDWKKRFVVDATAWVASETPDTARLVTNEKYIAYFSDREVDWQQMADSNNLKLENLLSNRDALARADYLVVYLRARHEAQWRDFLEAGQREETRSFGDGDKGRVAVVQLRAPASELP